jgi:predicted SprT family Zn-dependent metalloprotease
MNTRERLKAKLAARASASPLGRCEAKLRELREQTAELWPDLEMPTFPITYNLRGHTAGMLRLRNGRVRDLRINGELLQTKAYTDDMVENTLGHEWAHAIQYVKYFAEPWRGSIYRRAHGEGWKQIMRRLGLKPTRCHNYQTISARRQRSVDYSCQGCDKVYQFTTRRHNKVLRGYSYLCGECRGKLIEV